jgi:hypothetical protein
MGRRVDPDISRLKRGGWRGTYPTKGHGDTASGNTSPSDYFRCHLGLNRLPVLEKGDKDNMRVVYIPYGLL